MEPFPKQCIFHLFCGTLASAYHNHSWYICREDQLLVCKGKAEITERTFLVREPESNKLACALQLILLHIVSISRLMQCINDHFKITHYHSMFCRQFCLAMYWICLWKNGEELLTHWWLGQIIATHKEIVLKTLIDKREYWTFLGFSGQF